MAGATRAWCARIPRAGPIGMESTPCVLVTSGGGSACSTTAPTPGDDGLTQTRRSMVFNPRVRSILVLLGLVLVGACSPRRIAEILFVGDHFLLETGLPFGAADRQRLDVYRPRDAGGPGPVIVFLFGGRWQTGSRAEYRLLGSALTRRGWVVVVPDYRLYPPARFPDWVRDAAAAVRWTRDNAERFGGDADRVFVVGHSAGAHTAALLALDGSYLAQAGVPADRIQGFVSVAGPVDTVWTDPEVQTLMGPRQGWPDTYPASHVGGGDRPLLLLHGTGDETVTPSNSVRLDAMLRRSGSCARTILYPGVGHVRIVVALALPRLGIAPVLEDLARFVRDPVAVACGPAPA